MRQPAATPPTIVHPVFPMPMGDPASGSNQLAVGSQITVRATPVPVAATHLRGMVGASTRGRAMLVQPTISGTCAKTTETAHSLGVFADEDPDATVPSPDWQSPPAMPLVADPTGIFAFSVPSCPVSLFV